MYDALPLPAWLLVLALCCKSLVAEAPATSGSCCCLGDVVCESGDCGGCCRTGLFGGATGLLLPFCCLRNVSGEGGDCTLEQVADAVDAVDASDDVLLPLGPRELLLSFCPLLRRREKSLRIDRDTLEVRSRALFSLTVEADEARDDVVLDTLP